VAPNTPAVRASIKPALPNTHRAQYTVMALAALKLNRYEICRLNGSSRYCRHTHHYPLHLL
jgi:hypothetical protein